MGNDSVFTGKGLGLQWCSVSKEGSGLHWVGVAAPSLALDIGWAHSVFTKLDGVRVGVTVNVHRASGTSLGFITLFTVYGGPDRFGKLQAASKQQASKHARNGAKSQPRRGASNLAKILVDATYGSEGQPHKV